MNLLAGQQRSGKWNVLVTQSRPTLLWSMDYIAHQASLSMVFPSKNTGVGSHSLLQAIFPTQESNSVSCIEVTSLPPEPVVHNK